MKAILGTKVGMTQIFDENGVVIPVTVVQAGPMVVTQIKTVEKDGYAAVQMAYGDTKEKSLNKPQKGHLAKAGVGVKKFLREFRLEEGDNYELAQDVKVDVFEVGDKVDVTGTSKGKGFQGPVKRHGVGRGPETHGSHYHRGPGSMGSASDPSRVFKGKRLAGHMGAERVTIQNLEVAMIDVENNLILIKGAIPGPKKSLVTIKRAVKA